MTNNTSGSGDQGVSESPQSPPISPLSPSPSPSQSPATPVSGPPASPTTTNTGTAASSSVIVAGPTIASTGTAASFGVSVGGPTIASTGIANASAGGSGSHSIVPPRKREHMLAAGEGSSGEGGGEEPRNVRPNVPPPDAVPVEQRRCSVCEKEFGSVKALFGHMNSHPNRGWKGAYPPPTFNREEEFADFDLQVPIEPNVEVADEPERPNEVLPDLNAPGPAPEPGEEQYKLPDLNLPPPAEE
ncbi:uncharacterized protein LOC132623956 [Lycium barbarum]|uniref:uncharacterized protein LOC132623956 n=1 Tax=Lycium barbarum TaxID=112863 RepID=UPI00293E43F0|nr:uncharacterized protein LOC132623956 [Lycium barbarum]